MIDFKQLNSQIKNAKEELEAKVKEALKLLEDDLKENWDAFNLILLNLDFLTNGTEDTEERLVLMFDVSENQIIIRHLEKYYNEAYSRVEEAIANDDYINHRMEFIDYKNKTIDEFDNVICEEIASMFHYIEDIIMKQIKEEIERLQGLLKKVKPIRVQ